MLTLNKDDNRNNESRSEYWSKYGCFLSTKTNKSASTLIHRESTFVPGLTQKLTTLATKSHVAFGQLFHGADAEGDSPNPSCNMKASH